MDCSLQHKDCSPPGSSVHGILQARTLEWVAIQGIFLTQGLNLGLLHCRQTLYHMSHQGSLQECSNYHTTVFISHACKVKLKILPARLQQYMNQELPDVQAGVRKGRGTRGQIATILWIIDKAREFQKNIYFCFIDMLKPLTVWITANCGKFLKKWKYQML